MSQRVNKARGGLALSLPLPLSSGGMWAGLPEPRAGRVRSEGKSFGVETTGFWGDPADSAPPGKVGWLPTQAQCAVGVHLPSSRLCARSGRLASDREIFK